MPKKKPAVPTFPGAFAPRKVAASTPSFALPKPKPKSPPPPVPTLEVKSKPAVPIVPRMLGVPRALSQKPNLPMPRQLSQKPKMKAPAPVFATLGGNSSVVEEVVRAKDLEKKPFETVVHNEYNPARPNDYEEYCMEREKRRKAEKEEDKRREVQEKRPEFKGRVLAAPSDKKIDLNMSADDVFARRAAMSKPSSKMGPPAMGPPSMGKPKPLAQGAAKRQKLEPPSRVIMLRNMVGRGQVDPELQGEISEECAKFGNVLKCKIHEFKEKACPVN
jgi:hypothetical protein